MIRVIFEGRGETITEATADAARLAAQFVAEAEADGSAPGRRPEPVAPPEASRGRGPRLVQKQKQEPVLTLGAVKGRATAFGQRFGAGALRVLLTVYKVSRVSEIPEDQWPDLLSRIASAAAAREQGDDG